MEQVVQIARDRACRTTQPVVNREMLQRLSPGLASSVEAKYLSRLFLEYKVYAATLNIRRYILALRQANSAQTLGDLESRRRCRKSSCNVSCAQDPTKYKLRLHLIFLSPSSFKSGVEDIHRYDELKGDCLPY